MRVLRFVGAFLGILAAILAGVGLFIVWTNWVLFAPGHDSMAWFLVSPLGVIGAFLAFFVLATIARAAWDWSKK